MRRRRCRACRRPRTESGGRRDAGQARLKFAGGAAAIQPNPRIGVDGRNRVKILLADESRAARQFIASHLETLGHAVLEAANAAEVMTLLQAESPDVLMLSIAMHEPDGYALVRTVRALEGQGPAAARSEPHADWRGDWVPIVLLGDHIGEEEMLRGLDAGCDEFLVRPPSRAALRVKLHAMGRIAQMRRRLIAVGSELRDVNASLRQLSTLDALTGVANRHSFDQMLQELAQRAVATRRPLTLLLGDIDYFKRYNDYYGMQAGDECLRQVAVALQRSVRAGECIARFGGEEFAILLPDADSAGAELVAGRVLANIRALRRPHTTSRCAEHVTLSLGVAVSADGAHCDPAALTELAQRALYRAKLQGRNQAAIELLGGPPQAVALAG